MLNHNVKIMGNVIKINNRQIQTIKNIIFLIRLKNVYTI